MCEDESICGVYPYFQNAIYSRLTTNNNIRTPPKSDVFLAIQDPYVQQIVTGSKTYELWKYHLEEYIERIWFYRTVPYSIVKYICEILPAKTRNPGDLPLKENGLGNEEFNTKHEDWEGYDFAYRFLSVYKLDKPITLNDLMNEHGMEGAPRGFVYTPGPIMELVDWHKQ